MILADASAWIEFLRRTKSSTHEAFRDAFENEMLAATEVVVMELLAGARDDSDLLVLSRMLATVPLLPVGGLEAWETAAAIHRGCRSAGRTIRSHLDCLIAAVAIRERVPVMHADRDFDVIAEHTPLQVAG